jgi:hypothetical protein
VHPVCTLLGWKTPDLEVRGLLRSVSVISAAGDRRPRRRGGLNSTMRTRRIAIPALAALVAAMSLLAAAPTPAPAASASASASTSVAEQMRAAARRARELQATGALAQAAEREASATASPPVPTMSIHDRVGDVPFPQGDITDTGFAQNKSYFVFETHVKNPVDPATDPQWKVGNAFVGWALDTNGDGVADFIAIFFETGRQGSVIFGADLGGFCIGSGRYLKGVGYRSVFTQGCPSSVSRFRFQAGVGYTDDPDRLEDTFDLAPNGRFSTAYVLVGVHKPGYWMLGADGVVYGFGAAKAYVSKVFGASAMANTRDGSGYWVVDAAGGVFPYGAALKFGEHPRLVAGERVTTISATPSGMGYWLFSNLGRAFPYGDAHSFGDLSGSRLNGGIVASVATPTGKGYFMVGADGGIFAFGDAVFRGSTGAKVLNAPIVGIAPTKDNRGYWLVATDGGVFAFNAPFLGSMGAVRLNQPVRGLVAYGNGYLMAAADGGVFNFSDQKFLGSLAGLQLSAPIIGVNAFTT